MLSSKQRMIKNVVSKACETKSIVYREGIIRLIKKYGDNEPDEREHLLVRKEYFDAVCNRTIDVLCDYYYDAEGEIRCILRDPGIIGLDDFDVKYGASAGLLFVVCCTIFDKKPLKNFVDAVELNHYQNDVMSEELRYIDENYPIESYVDESKESTIDIIDDDQREVSPNVTFKTDEKPRETDIIISEEELINTIIVEGALVRRNDYGLIGEITKVIDEDTVSIMLIGDGEFFDMKINKSELLYDDSEFEIVNKDELSDEEDNRLVTLKLYMNSINSKAGESDDYDNEEPTDEEDDNYKDDPIESRDDSGPLVKSNDGLIFLDIDEDYPDKLILNFDYITDEDLDESDYFYLLNYSTYLNDYYSDYLNDNDWSIDDEEGWWINDYNNENLTFVTELINKYDSMADELLEEYDDAITKSGEKFREYVHWEIIGYLNKRSIERKIISSDKLSYTISNLNSKLKDALCEIVFDDKGYTVYAYSKFEADLESPYEMLKYLHMANYRMTRCNFEINMKDGVIRLKSRYDTDWSSAPKLTEAMLQRSIFNPAQVLDEYGNGIVALSLGFSNAEDEIRKVEGPTETVEDDDFYPEPFTAISEDIPF